MYLATKVMMTGGSTDTLKHHLYRFPHGKLVDARIVTHVRYIDTRMKSQKLTMQSSDFALTVPVRR